jgi:hypothetical protein
MSEPVWEDTRKARVTLTTDERAKLDLLTKRGYAFKYEPLPDDPTRVIVFVHRSAANGWLRIEEAYAIETMR